MHDKGTDTCKQCTITQRAARTRRAQQRRLAALRHSRYGALVTAALGVMLPRPPDLSDGFYGCGLVQWLDAPCDALAKLQVAAHGIPVRR